MPIPVKITTYVATAITQLTNLFRNKPKIEALYTTNANARVIVIDAQDSVLYTITLDGTPVNYNSGLLETEITIAAGLVAAINAAALDLIARQEIDTGNMHIFAASTGIDFTISVTANLVARRTAFIDQVQELETVFDNLMRQRGILDDGSGNQAEGEQLDGLGRIVGLAREPGQDDATYRDFLFIQVTRNRSSGEADRLIEILAGLTGATEVELVEYFPGLVIMTFAGTVVNESRLSSIMDSLAAAGVRLNLVHAPPPIADVFAFAGGSGKGFNDGIFAGVI